MTEQKLQAEYVELVSSGTRVPLMTDCFLAKLADVARKELGGNDAAGALLGVHTTTISRWHCGGRALAVGEQLQSTVGRIAAALFADEQAGLIPAAGTVPDPNDFKPAERILTAFHDGLATAAIAQSEGRKGRAAKLLGVHRNWILRYETRSARRSA